MAESGFPEAAQAIKATWEEDGHEAATMMVPDTLTEAISVTGTPAECRERVEAYRRAGITLPVISPRPGGPHPKQMVIEALRACAP
jgi:alkanesulfonate monooxygenase SsuD/methylene tetrahydromethanopterin reductase-like flavin-dependent oxidoreductase (luciferase family)